MAETRATIEAAVTEVTTTSAPRPLFGHGRADPDAAPVLLAELYQEHGRSVLGLCRLLLRDPAEAEDAAQHTFLSAYRSLLAGTEPEHPAAWLATIARNECWGRIQQRMRQPVPEELSAELASTLPQPPDAAVRHGELAELFAAIRALPRQQRDALLLRELSGLSYAELAEALTVSERAVESLLVRARRELRARLQRTFAASIAPLLLLKDWLSRLGDGGESSLGAAAKLGSVTLAAKVAAGAATLTVVGGTVVADGAELARSSSAAAERPPVRQRATLDGSRNTPAVRHAGLRTEVRVAHHGRLGEGRHEGRGSDASDGGGGSRGPDREGREQAPGDHPSSGPGGRTSGGDDERGGQSSGPGSGKESRDAQPALADGGSSKSGPSGGGGEPPESGIGGTEAPASSGSGGESGSSGGSGSSGSGEGSRSSGS